MPRVSVLFNEPKLLKSDNPKAHIRYSPEVSVLFNEPKLLKLNVLADYAARVPAFQCSSTSRNC